MLSLHSCSVLKLSCLLLFLVYPTVVSSKCTCDMSESGNGTRGGTLKYKLGSIASVLVAGSAGVSIPLLGRRIQALSPENDIFLLIKAFAAGVILCTGFIHILPDAFDNLSSPCLNENPWGNFPFTGFIAMMSAIGTLMVDSFATGFYQRLHFNKIKEVNMDRNVDQERGGSGGGGGGDHEGHVHVHTHGTHGHAHGSASLVEHLTLSEMIRRRIISQVLELGIVVHSVIIGISLGASGSVQTIKPLMAALSFHQFFEGMGLGGCISQAKFKSRSVAVMATFFSLTTPVGIAIGIAISSVYKENSPTALIVEGVFNSASAGILIYMALVDLLAADFMSPRMQSNFRTQLGANISLLLGSGCMSLLAKWA